MILSLSILKDMKNSSIDMTQDKTWNDYYIVEA